MKVGNCSVVVKGTKFDVTAYPDDSLITTTLLEGAVGFTAPRGETLLRPGESLTYDRFAETTAITHVNTAQYLAWIEGRIEFIDVTIVQLCESLSSLYGVEITLDDRLRADGTFITIRLSNQESLDSVLKALDLIGPDRAVDHVRHPGAEPRTSGHGFVRPHARVAGAARGARPHRPVFDQGQDDRDLQGVGDSPPRSRDG